MFRADRQYQYFRVTFDNPTQAVLRGVAAAVQERFASRQPPIWDWAMDAGDMSGAGSFLLLAWPAKSTVTYNQAYETMAPVIGATCDDWELHLWHTDAAAEQSPSLADFISTASEATLVDWLQALPISKADLRKLQAAAASAEGTEDA